MTRTPQQNLDSIAKLAKQNFPGEPGYCLQAIRTACGAPGMGGTAYQSYLRVPTSRRHAGKPPAGYPGFYSGGSSGAGHVILGAGGPGLDDVWSTDFKRSGRLDVVSFDAIDSRWVNLKYLGWTTEINGVILADPAPLVTTCSVKHLNARRADHAMSSQVKAVKKALYAEGYRGMTMTGDGASKWGKGTQAAYDQFRRQKLGYSGADAKGSVGLTSLSKLASRHKAILKAVA